MQRLSDVMSNVNLTLHRRLVPAGKAMQRVFFHNLALQSILLSSKPSLSFDFCVDLRSPLSLFTHYVPESVGGAKQAAM